MIDLAEKSGVLSEWIELCKYLNQSLFASLNCTQTKLFTSYVCNKAKDRGILLKQRFDNSVEKKKFQGAYNYHKEDDNSDEYMCFIDFSS